MIFKAEDIIWVKNVKRDKGSAWAYYEEDRDNVFYLNFSKTQVKGASLVRPGEVILLFQKVDKISGVERKTYLTHLVTPLDEEIRFNSKIEHDFKWERKVAIIARASLDNKIYSTPSNLNFYKPNRGKVCSVALLNDSKPINQIQNEIWSLFKDQFVDNVENLFYQESNTFESPYDSSFSEGRLIKEIKEHYRRERSPVVINLAKKRAKENGNLKCECCGFDFYKSYKEEFIECHHKSHISEGERETSIDDLALVCSNCHRMLHRRINNGDYHSVESLRNLICLE
ncbi:HNH endonuclease [Sphingobacterium sp. N143]|uniref:HNH endonuclease n=1 Tax=Sphingobacterium sp. N143 TaxID=2746727 RepID=UPI0025780C1F|nr:HNH endonuclease [Sphingobacterium sp. N143]MDM1296525.1 HNH endonuclease [Sphingobacterium sp. N143]